MNYKSYNALIIISSIAALAALYFTGKRKPSPRLTGGWKIPNAGLMYKYYFDRASLFYQLPKNLLARMAQQESDYDNKAVSNRGAVGLMQIIPRFHPSVDPTNSEASIFYAAEYMRNLYNRFGSWKLALAAYNWGPTNLQEKGISRAPRETRNYITKIARDIALT